MRNGMWIRTALIAMTFGCDKRIHEYHRQICKGFASMIFVG